MNGKLIGLTGMCCAGKNHVASLLEKRGLPTLDVDKLGHEALENCSEAVIARFGGAVLEKPGKIDRKKLAEKVFGNPEALAALEAIVHPEANRLTEAWIAGLGGKNCVINAALLHKSCVFERLDCIILVKAPFFVRLLRARKRDKLKLPVLIRRLWSQKDFHRQYIHQSTIKNGGKKADMYIIENRGFLECFRRFHSAKLENQIDAILSGKDRGD